MGGAPLGRDPRTGPLGLSEVRRQIMEGTRARFPVKEDAADAAKEAVVPVME